MTLANVSFGIFAFTPLGWLFMALIIILESWIASRYLAGKKLDGTITRSFLAGNIISGIVGIAASMLATGGWWLVVWFPWVTDHEVKPDALPGFIVYYLVAFVLSVLIEWGVNQAVLHKKYKSGPIFKATLLANIASYIFGSGALLLISLF